MEQFMAIGKLKQILSGDYLRNVGWMASAELANRIIRLAGTVVLARMFSPQDYGLMAIIYTLSDVFQVFTLRGGVGAKIIQADEQDVKTICNTAYWLNWITCGSLFILQCIFALLLPHFSPKDSTLTLPLIVFAFTYLAYPFFVTHLILVERENGFKTIASCNVLTSFVSSILIAIFALIGLGIWSIIFSALLSISVQIIFAWRVQPWRPPIRFSLEHWREILDFGGNLLVSDLLVKVRANVDYVIVGKYLGLEALGMYYFAFNSGSGITMNLLNTFMSPLYPYICEVRHDYFQFKQRYFSSIKKTSVILLPIILLQAFLAPIYVPLVFGQTWTPAIPVLILICLSVIPRIYSWASTLLLNAIGKTRISLYISIASTVIFVLSILTVVQNGIVWVAFAVLLNCCLVSFFIVVCVYPFAFRKEHFPKSFY
jgi:PST family polysaccharide transporter